MHLHIEWSESDHHLNRDLIYKKGSPHQFIIAYMKLFVVIISRAL